MRRILEEWLILVCVSLVGMGCASSTAPKGWLPGPAEARTNAFGGWITVRYQGPDSMLTRHGELIAIDKDSIQILGKQGFMSIKKQNIKRAKLVAYQTERGTISQITFLGALSTFSNGPFLIFTLPLWIIGGSLAAASESRAAQLEYPDKPWEVFRAYARFYARFPQGLPEGIDVKQLRHR